MLESLEMVLVLRRGTKSPSEMEAARPVQLNWGVQLGVTAPSEMVLGMRGGGKVTFGNGGAATGRTCGDRSGAGGGRTMAWSKMLAMYSM